MARAGGIVDNRMASVNLRRKTYRTPITVLTAAAPTNLVVSPYTAPLGARFILDSFCIVNTLTINDVGMGTLKVGHALTAGTLDDDSIISLTNTNLNTGGTFIMQNTAIWKRLNVPSTSFLTTLKTGEIKHPIGNGKAILPRGASLIVTWTAMASTGTGAAQLIFYGWEYDDENS